MEFPGIQEDKTKDNRSIKLLEYIRQSFVTKLLISDYLICVGCNIYITAALLLIAKVSDSPLQFSEVMVWSSSAIILILPFAGYLTNRIGVNRMLVLSLVAYSVYPLLFFGLINIGCPLRYVAILSGVIVGLNFPASAALTFDVIPKDLLRKFYFFVMFSSAITSVAYPLTAYLFALNPLACFISASIVLLAAAYICHKAIISNPNGDSEKHELKHRTLSELLENFKSHKFFLFAGFRVMSSLSFYVFFFVVFVRVIMPRIKEEGAGAVMIGHVLGMVIVAALLLTIVLNYILRVSIKSFFVLFLSSSVASVSIYVFFENTYVLAIIYGLCIPLLFTGSGAIFSNLGYAFDVRCPFSQSVFYLISMSGALLSFSMINFSIRYMSLRYLLLCFSGLCIVASILSKFLVREVVEN